MLTLSALTTLPLQADSVSDALVWYTDNNCLYKSQTTTTDTCYSYNNQASYNDVTYDKDTGITTLKSTGTTEAYSYIDSAVNTKQGDYVVMIAFTQASEVLPDQNITGLPYVYGYQMTDSNHIVQYMQGQNTMYNNGEAGHWALSYGIFPAESDQVVRIRFFMEQASRLGTDYDGSTAMFKRPGVYVVSSQDAANEVVAGYQAALTAQTVTNIAKAKIEQTATTIDWQSQENAEKYIVKLEQRDTTKVLHRFTVVADGTPLDTTTNDSTLNITNLTPGQKYDVYVRSVVNGVKSDWSNRIKFKTLKQ